MNSTSASARKATTSRRPVTGPFRVSAQPSRSRFSGRSCCRYCYQPERLLQHKFFFSLSQTLTGRHRARSHSIRRRRSEKIPCKKPAMVAGLGRANSETSPGNRASASRGGRGQLLLARALRETVSAKNLRHYLGDAISNIALLEPSFDLLARRRTRRVRWVVVRPEVVTRGSKVPK